MAKYITVRTGNIITRIATRTKIKGYTKSVFESFLPEDEELYKMTNSQLDEWIKNNNIRMEQVCKFLNEKNL